MLLDVHGVRAEIIGTEIQAELGADFSYFVSEAEAAIPPAVTLVHIAEAIPSGLLPTARATQIHPSCVVYDKRTKDGVRWRWIDYHGEALILRRTRGESIEAELYCEDPGLAHELAYLFLQSEIGRRLDKGGLHRVHALGVAKGENAGLVLVPSGGGKSTLGIPLLESGKFQLLSDDAPLVDRRGRLAPFPLRLAFTPQTELPAAWENRTVAFSRRKFGAKKLLAVEHLPGSCPPHSRRYERVRVILGRRWGSLSSPALKRIGRLRAAPSLVRDLVVGLGLPQVAELVLTSSWGTLPSLAPTAASRALAVAQLLRRAEIFELRLSRDSRANAALVAEALEA